MKQQSNIYVVADGMHDYSSAKVFGKLIFVSEEFIPKLDVTKMARVFAPFVESSHASDFIVQGGPNVMLSLLCSMFALKHGRLNLLIFSKDGYRKRSIVFKREEDDEN